MQAKTLSGRVRGILAVALAWGSLIAGYSESTAQSRQLITSFDRDVNRFRWSTTADLDTRLLGWNVSFTNRMASEALVFGDRYTNFRDENVGNWSLQRPVSDRFQVVSRGQGVWFSQSDVSAADTYLGMRYTHSPTTSIEPVIGFAWDRRPGVPELDGTYNLRSDRGFATGIVASVRPVTSDEYTVNLTSNASWQLISPRQGRAAQVGATVVRSIDEARLVVDLEYINRRRDVYEVASFLNRESPGGRESETVESTSSDTLVAAVRFDAPLGSGFTLTSHLTFLSSDRHIRTLRAPPDALFFDTDYNRRLLDGEVSVQYESREYLARLTTGVSATVERRTLANREELPPTQVIQKGELLRQADFDRGRYTVGTLLRAPIGNYLTAVLQGSASILRHDTPEINADDRDEAFHTARAGLLWRLSRYLEIDFQMLASYYHTVYLRGIRSAENNTQRSLRLRPTLRWSPGPNTRFELTSEVRATYTVDDFRLEEIRPNDQSARELRYEARLEHRFSRDIGLRYDGTVSDLRLGVLRWEDFAEVPFDTLRTYAGWMRLQVGQRLISEIGTRFFIRNDYDRGLTVRYSRVDEDGTVIRDPAGAPSTATVTRPGREWILQVGPTCSIQWLMTNGSHIRLEGWLQVQRVRHELYGELPEPQAGPIRRAARTGTRRIIPNMSVSVIWNL